jgi:3-oxoadipate enol-lactonase
MPLVELSHCSVLYLDVGQGAPLVFIHGFPLDHTMWRYQIDEFQKSHRVLAIDLPGFGQSSAPRSEMSIIGFADSIAEFLQRVGIEEKVTLCGLSMGGSIALQFALRHPEKLARLILCDCRAAVDTPEAQKMRLDLAERVLKEGPEFVATAMPARLFALGTIEQQPEVVQSIQAVIRATASASVAGGSRALAHRLDVIPRLGEICVPTLIIVGSEDVISTVDEMKVMAERIPGSQHVVIPGAGHMAPLEAPDLVNAEIKAWLKAQ